jgi:hypothetical protein
MFLFSQELVDDADLIIECTFTGERRYSYQAFLSQVRVERVLKGDESLAGTEIPVYEPLAIGNRNTSSFFPKATGTALLAELFGYSEGAAFSQIEPSPSQSAYMNGGTLMAEADRYILFLNAREYSPAEDRSGKPDEYVPCTSFYSKLRIDPLQDPKTYVPPAEHISLTESLHYDILALDAASAHEYYAARDELLRLLSKE